MDILLTMLMLALAIWFIVALFACVGDMARARGHSPWPWWLVALIWSPFAAIALLWLFFSRKPRGDAD